MNALDEFGRDPLLRNKTLFQGLNKYKNKSWFDIEILLEEEEIAQRTKENREKFKAQMEDRYKLYLQGLYELEEGEVIHL